MRAVPSHTTDVKTNMVSAFEYKLLKSIVLRRRPLVGKRREHRREKYCGEDGPWRYHCILALGEFIRRGTDFSTS